MDSERTSEKRFEVTVNFNTNQFDIYDRFNHDGRLEIYNDLGCVQFSSAPALCKVLNELVEENLSLRKYIKEHNICSVCDTCEYCIGTHINDYNGVDYDVECKKGHMDMEIQDCTDYKLTSEVFK